MNSRQKKVVTGGVFTGVVLIIILVLCIACLNKVKPGYAGVVYKVNGGVTGEVVGQGWHWCWPGTKLVQYSIGIEQSYLTASDEGDSPEDDSFSAPSADGKGLMMELTFTYRFDETRVADTFVKFKGRSGQDVLTTFIKPNVISWTKEITAKYPVTEILGDKRSELNVVLSDYLAERFDPYGIIITNASLINIEPDSETKAAIQKKVNAQQELELAQVEAQTAKINADKDKEVALIEAQKQKEVALIEAEKNKEAASLNAEKAKIEAEGKAAAIKIEANAEAEANLAIAASLTPSLIDKIKYEKWNGELPQIQSNEGTSQIIDMRESQ